MEKVAVSVMDSRVSIAYWVFPRLSVTFRIQVPIPTISKPFNAKKHSLQRKELEKGLNIAKYTPLTLIYYSTTRKPR